MINSLFFFLFPCSNPLNLLKTSEASCRTHIPQNITFVTFFISLKSPENQVQKIVVRMEYDGGATRWRHRRSSTEKLVLISLTFLAILSPLIIDRREAIEPEPEEEPIDISSLGPVLLVVLIIAVAISCYLDKSLTRFDPYWIYRVGGSSSGIVIVLMVLALVLKCKASPADVQ